jgi:ornithine cyclodeaminase/alanine dehydrogenase-like protein (mu-crystallin family)
MSILYLTEENVRQLLSMEMALQAVEAGLKKISLDEATNIPRTRCQTDHATLHVLSAAAKSLNALGFKAYTTTKKGDSFHVTLFDSRTGRMTCLMQADFLGQMRTGAASGVATRKLARPEASTVGLFGTGKQARTQIIAVCAVRTIKSIHVYSRSEENRKTFAAEMAEICKTEVIPTSNPEQAARNRDIVITATSSREPVLKGEWLTEGTHLNIIGSNLRGKAEVDKETIRRSNLVTIDSKDQGELEAGDFVAALEDKLLDWVDVIELGHILAGRFPGRENPQQITLFKSLGVGIEDVAVGQQVYTKAVQLGVGRTLEEVN